MGPAAPGGEEHEQIVCRTHSPLEGLDDRFGGGLGRDRVARPDALQRRERHVPLTGTHHLDDPRRDGVELRERFAPPDRGGSDQMTRPGLAKLREQLSRPQERGERHEHRTDAQSAVGEDRPFGAVFEEQGDPLAWTHATRDEPSRHLAARRVDLSIAESLLVVDERDGPARGPRAVMQQGGNRQTFNVHRNISPAPSGRASRSTSRAPRRDGVSRRCGAPCRRRVARARLYYYFSNKQDLFQCATGSAVERNALAAERLATQDGAPAEKVEQLFFDLLDSYTRLDYPYMFVFLDENVGRIARGGRGSGLGPIDSFSEQPIRDRRHEDIRAGHRVERLFRGRARTDADAGRDWHGRRDASMVASEGWPIDRGTRAFFLDDTA